jgi:predicted nucleotidyltransferase
LTLAPQKGTIAPNMSTSMDGSQLAETLFGKTRRAVLSLLYGHADETFYLRQVVKSAGSGMGAVQRELKALSNAGIIRRSVLGNQVYYQAEPLCPVFTELKSLVMKTAGVGDILKAALAPLADRIRTAFIYGSIARGNERKSSDVDIFIVGEVTFSDVVSVLSSVQQTLGREVNPTVYPPDEFYQKLTEGSHFVNSVLEEPKFFLIGDAHDLARLAQQRLADRA